MSAVLDRAGGRRRLLTVAGALALLSLGLPWGSAGPGRWTTGIYTPGFCSTIYDSNGGAYSECSPGFYLPGIHLPDGGAPAGYMTGIRVVMVVVIVLLTIGRRRPDGSLPILAVAVAALGWMLEPGAASGQIVYLLALAVLVTALHREGRLSRSEPAPRRPPHGSGPGPGRPAAAPAAPRR